MKSKKVILILFTVLITAFILGLYLPKFTSSESKLMPCYHAQVADSSSLLKIFSHDNNLVNGELIFQNYQKDSSYGVFNGELINKKLEINFKFQSEGVESTRQISLNLNGDSLVGEGFNFKPVENCNSITYNQGLGLIPFDMKLPLHLFPRIKLQTITEQELTNSFGPGGFKPIQSAKIVYTPTKGEPVAAVIFYLWQKSVWDVIANPNEAPDWGVMQWSDQSHVFSVNGVQDCVYPNEPDCGNISEIFKFIYDNNSYINKVPPYSEVKVKVTKTKTFHDPETGYYVVSEFNILGIGANQSYRCDISAFDKGGKVIISWSTEGLSFSPNPSTIYSGQTNIKPDQVSTVGSSTVKCKVADAIG